MSNIGLMLWIPQPQQNFLKNLFYGRRNETFNKKKEFCWWVTFGLVFINCALGRYKNQPKYLMLCFLQIATDFI